MVFFVDLPWLVERQALVMPTKVDVFDRSALSAAVCRHRVECPRANYEPDNSWRAAALLVTIAREEPLPVRNSFYAGLVAVGYMADSGERIDPPYGALPWLILRVREYKADVYAAAGNIRAWRS